MAVGLASSYLSVTRFKGALSRIFSISLNSQNVYLCRAKPKNLNLFLLPSAFFVSLAADGKDGNGLQLKFRLNFQVVSAGLQKVDIINGRGLFSLCQLR